MSALRGAGDRWLAGHPLEGVDFRLHDPVEIVEGQFTGDCGTVALLLAIFPQPVYLVALGARGDVRTRQSALRRSTPAV